MISAVWPFPEEPTKNTLVIPLTRFKEFERLRRDKCFPYLRYGQAFYNFMEFHKMDTENRNPDVESIYNQTDYQKVRAWIDSKIDPLH